MIDYDGTQLAPHWIYRKLGISGDALVAFLGAAHVPTEHMVDQHDVRANAPIHSPLMVHFLAEWFIDSLDQGILLQNLFIHELYALLWEQGVSKLTKQGNDIFYQGRKLSVSIATRSTLSVLMHTAVNVQTQGTPVPTSGLEEMGLDPKAFATSVLARYSEASVLWRIARTKVSARV